jgi:hypothetical protein
MVFRTPASRLVDHAIERAKPPHVLGFGIDRDAYILVTASDGALDRRAFAAHGTASLVDRARFDGPWTREGRCVIAERAWLHAEAAGPVLGAPQPDDPVKELRLQARWDHVFPLWIEGAMRLLAVRGEPGHGQRLALVDALSERTLRGPLPAGNTARQPLAACATVHGPIAIFSTDREDEVDVCALRDGGTRHKTVSLGHGQRFVTAAGGGSRLAIVSRNGNDVRVRTIASDLRSELNAVPLAPATRSTVGNVRAAHAGAATFVLAHEERSDEHEVVVTVFDDGKTRTVRSKFAAVHGLAIAGKHIAIAALTDGALAPRLYVQQLTLTRDEARGESYATAPKRRAYVFGALPTHSPRARRAALEDIAEVLSQSLAAQPPRALCVREAGSCERAAFVVPGADASKDLAVSIELHEDGSGIVNVKIGDRTAPDPRPLTAIERVRLMLTGDDDGDPSTSHFALRSLADELGEVVMAVWALRLTRS